MVKLLSALNNRTKIYENELNSKGKVLLQDFRVERHQVPDCPVYSIWLSQSNDFVRDCSSCFQESCHNGIHHIRTQLQKKTGHVFVDVFAIRRKLFHRGPTPVDFPLAWWYYTSQPHLNQLLVRKMEFRVYLRRTINCPLNWVVPSTNPCLNFP